MTMRQFGTRSAPRVGAFLVGDLGVVPLPAFQMSINLRWGVANSGSQLGYVGLKVWVIEKKAWGSDVEWWVYTPLIREGGPGMVRDIMASESGGVHQAYPGAELMPVPAGSSVQGVTSLHLAGTRVSQQARDFWNRHAGAPFKVVVQALQVDPDNFELIKALGAYTFDPAFTLGQEVAAGIAILATYAGVPQPELSIALL